MLHIFVDQKDKNAVALPDGLIEDFVDTCIKDYLKNEQDVTVTVSSELITHYFRVAVKQGKLPFNEIKMSTQAGDFVFLENMKCKAHPKDFISHFEEALYSLL